MSTAFDRLAVRTLRAPIHRSAEASSTSWEINLKKGVLLSMQAGECRYCIEAAKLSGSPRRHRL